MKKIGTALLCLLVLSGCGRARQSAALQEQYAAVTGAELAAEITCHLPDETRQYQVQEVARMCGWDSRRYFARSFRQKMGMSPSQYLEQVEKK